MEDGNNLDSLLGADYETGADADAPVQNRHDSEPIQKAPELARDDKEPVTDRDVTERSQNDRGSVHSSNTTNKSSALSAESVEFVPLPDLNTREDPYGWQLSHSSPRRNRFIQQGIHWVNPPTPALTAQDDTANFESSATEAEPNLETGMIHAYQPTTDFISLLNNPYAITLSPLGSPPLIFLPSSSSTGYTLSTHPIVTCLETQHPTSRARNAQYTPYLQLGHLELTDSLLTSICPANLNAHPCPHDSVFEWDWFRNRWHLAGGGCTLIRLCSQMQRNPPPPAPPFAFPVVLTNPAMLVKAERGVYVPRHVPNKAVTALRKEFRGEPLSLLPVNHADHALHCGWLHGVEETCSSLRRNEHVLEQNCGPVGRGEMCCFGHDLQSARVYSRRVLLREHKEMARAKRERPGVVWLDRWGNWCWMKKGMVWRVGKWAEGVVSESGGSEYEWVRCWEERWLCVWC